MADILKISWGELKDDQGQPTGKYGIWIKGPYAMKACEGDVVTVERKNGDTQDATLKQCLYEQPATAKEPALSLWLPVPPPPIDRSPKAMRARAEAETTPDTTPAPAGKSGKAATKGKGGKGNADIPF